MKGTNNKAKPKYAKKKSEDLIRKILEEISSSSSISIAKACKKSGVDPRSFHRWIETDEELRQRYARAKELQAELMAEEIIQIADDDSEDEIFIEEDTKEGKSARRVMNSEFVQRSRLRVDARKWLAAKLLPKKYGDRLGVDTTIDMAESVPERIAKVLKEVVAYAHPE
jgi:hypothetical protein